MENKKLLILGTAYSCLNINYNDFDEIWAPCALFSERYNIPKIDLGFEIHPMNQMVNISKEQKINYNRYNCPVFVQDQNDPLTKKEIKDPVTYPLDTILDYIKKINASIYFTSTFSYMLVYAAMQGYKNITLHKILMASENEYYLERPGMEYWIDLLGHKEHIKFTFSEDAEMWHEDILYGYKLRPNMWRLKSRNQYMWEIFMKSIKEIEKIIEDMNNIKGMKTMYSLVLNKTSEEDLKKMLSESDKIYDDKKELLKIKRMQFIKFAGALQNSFFYEERQY